MNLIWHTFIHFPALLDYIPLIPPEFDRLRQMTLEIIESRKKSKTRQDDFVDTIMELQKTVKNSPADSHVLNDDIVTAQGIIFFAAGFETTSNTMTTLLYNLAMNPDVQEKLYGEIKEVLEEHDGRVDHETIGELKYLEAAIQEDLRLLGPITLHARLCTKDCQVHMS